MKTLWKTPLALFLWFFFTTSLYAGYTLVDNDYIMIADFNARAETLIKKNPYVTSALVKETLKNIETKIKTEKWQMIIQKLLVDRKDGASRSKGYVRYEIDKVFYYISGDVWKHPHLPKKSPDIYYTNACYSERDENKVILQGNENIVLSPCVAFAPEGGWLLEFKRTGKESEGNMKRRIYDIYLENEKIYSDYQLTKFAGWDYAIYVVIYYPDKQQIYLGNRGSNEGNIVYDIPSQKKLMEFSAGSFSNEKEKIEIQYETLEQRYVWWVRYIYYTKNNVWEREEQTNHYEETFSPQIDMWKERTVMGMYTAERALGPTIIEWSTVTLKGVVYETIFDTNDLSTIVSQKKRTDLAPRCSSYFLNTNGYSQGKNISEAHIDESFVMRGDYYYVADLQIFENWNKEGYTPQSWKGGIFTYNIGQKYDNLQVGENEYRVVGYDEWGDIVCDDILVVKNVLGGDETSGTALLKLTDHTFQEHNGKLRVISTIVNKGNVAYLISDETPVGVSCHLDYHDAGVGYSNDIVWYINRDHAWEKIIPLAQEFIYTMDTEVNYEKFIKDLNREWWVEAKCFLKGYEKIEY